MKYPKQFLIDLQSSHIQEKYAKITTLTWDENPIREITGQITGGSSNIDGNSAIRTTISLTMISKDLDVTKYTVALRTKVKIEIGLKNNIDRQYPDIIWFKQGIFIVTNFNTTISANQNNISISGKDKGCLLNGEISGAIPVSTDFGKVDDYGNSYILITNFTYRPGVYYIKIKDKYILDYSLQKIPNQEYYEKISSVTTTDLPIKEIIRNAVHIYGHIPWHKIIVNDLDLYGSQLLKYCGDKPLYLIKEENTNINMFVGLTFNGSFTIGGTQIGSLNDDQYLSLQDIDNTVNTNVLTLQQDEKDYQVVKITYGQTMGYKGTELTYPGNLIGNVGETVVSILDKIKNILGNFEYFFDVDGNFVFQAKHTYENVNFSKISTTEDNEVLIDGSFYNNNYIWSFSDEKTNTQITHTPQIINLKNDFSIWGERQSANGTKLPVHLRYAIQKKPQKYTSFNGITYLADDYITEDQESIKEQSDDILLSAYQTYQDYKIKEEDIKQQLSDREDQIIADNSTQKMTISNFLYQYTNKLKIVSENYTDIPLR